MTWTVAAEEEEDESKASSVTVCSVITGSELCYSCGDYTVLAGLEQILRSQGSLDDSTLVLVPAEENCVCTHLHLMSRFHLLHIFSLKTTAQMCFF